MAYRSWLPIILALLAVGTGKASAACSSSPLALDDIEICVVQPLEFGSVTAPRIGEGSLTIAPDGQRTLGLHVNDVLGETSGVNPAIVRVRGYPNERFRLSLAGASPIIDQLSTTLGPTNEGIIGPTGEMEVRIGTTIRLDRGDVGTISEQFTVTAEHM